MKFEYYIDMDERGEFRADVRDTSSKTVWETNGDVFEDGYMKHKDDLRGLVEYLTELGIMTLNDRLVKGA